MLSLGDNLRRPAIPQDAIYSEAHVKLDVPYYPGMRPDFGDLRLTYSLSQDSQEIDADFWIESFVPGQNAAVFVRLPRVDTKSRLYMYYGNPLLHGRGDPVKTFYFATGFDANSTSQWTRIAGSWSVATSPSSKSGFSFLVGPQSAATKSVKTTEAIFTATFEFDSNNATYYLFIPVTASGRSIYAVMASDDGHFGYYHETYHHFPIDLTWKLGERYTIMVPYNVSARRYWVYINDMLVTPDGLPIFEYQSQRLVAERSHFTQVGLLTKTAGMTVTAIIVRSLRSSLTYEVGPEEDLSYVASVFPAQLTSNDTTSYTLDLIPSSANFLVLEESYDGGWVAKQGRDETQLPHCKALGFLNGWRLGNDRTRITIVFAHEIMGRIGIAMSTASAAILVIIYLSASKKQSRVASERAPPTRPNRRLNRAVRRVGPRERNMLA